MKPAMKLRFTELGAIGLVALLIFFGVAFVIGPSALEQSTAGKIVAAALVLPAVLFGLSLVIYCAAHATFTRRWPWHFVCVFFWPLALVYWWRYIRPELAHDAQQGAPADPPRPAGSAGG